MPLMPSYSFPEVVPHGPIEQVLPDIYMVSAATVPVPMFFGLTNMTFSRNMIILKAQDNSNDLILVNTVRLNEKGLGELDKLGKVKHVLRLAGHHGMDDPFYQHHYGAKVWAIEDTPYFAGFSFCKENAYFAPDEFMVESTKLPIGTLLVLAGRNPPLEGVLMIDHERGKVLVAGDALQNWQGVDPYFNWMGRFLMKMMGFIKPYNIGPGWVQACKVKRSVLSKLLDLKFDHAIPAHGRPVIDDAWKKFEPAIQAMKQ